MQCLGTLQKHKFCKNFDVVSRVGAEFLSAAVVCWLITLCIRFPKSCSNLCPKLGIFKLGRVCALGECSSKAALRAHEKGNLASRCRAIQLSDSGLSQAPLEPQLTDSSSQRFPRTTHEHFQGHIPSHESHLERFMACSQMHQQRLEELVAKITFRLTFNQSGIHFAVKHGSSFLLQTCWLGQIRFPRHFLQEIKAKHIVQGLALV